MTKTKENSNFLLVTIHFFGQYLAARKQFFNLKRPNLRGWRAQGLR